MNRKSNKTELIGSNRRFFGKFKINIVNILLTVAYRSFVIVLIKTVPNLSLKMWTFIIYGH